MAKKYPPSYCLTLKNHTEVVVSSKTINENLKCFAGVFYYEKYEILKMEKYLW